MNSMLWFELVPAPENPPGAPGTAPENPSGATPHLVH